MLYIFSAVVGFEQAVVEVEPDEIITKTVFPKKFFNAIYLCTEHEGENILIAILSLRIFGTGNLDG